MKDKQIENEFMEMIKKHQGIIHKICFIYCKNNSYKQDLYQEIILQLWKSFPSFKGKSNFSTWMYRVSLNTAITMTKRKNVFVNLKDNQVEPFRIDYTFEYSEDLKILLKAISKLNNVEKGIILLWLEEKTYEEIAETIGISIKNVSVKLVRIKSKLAEIIKKLQ